MGVLFTSPYLTGTAQWTATESSTDLNLYSARVEFICMLFILFLEHLNLCCALLQWRPEADDIIQLVADIRLAVSQLLL